jgi:hypothetical protein
MTGIVLGATRRLSVLRAVAFAVTLIGHVVPSQAAEGKLDGIGPLKFGMSEQDVTNVFKGTKNRRLNFLGTERPITLRYTSDGKLRDISWNLTASNQNNPTFAFTCAMFYDRLASQLVMLFGPPDATLKTSVIWRFADKSFAQVDQQMNNNGAECQINAYVEKAFPAENFQMTFKAEP